MQATAHLGVVQALQFINHLGAPASDTPLASEICLKSQELLRPVFLERYEGEEETKNSAPAETRSGPPGDDTVRPRPRAPATPPPPAPTRRRLRSGTLSADRKRDALRTRVASEATVASSPPRVLAVLRGAHPHVNRQGSRCLFPGRPRSDRGRWRTGGRLGMGLRHRPAGGAL